MMAEEDIVPPEKPNPIAPAWLSKLSSPFGDATVIIAMATAVLYFAGRLYIESYYGKLGIPETELPFDIPYVMKSSFLPLLQPLFYLVLASCVAMTLSQHLDRQITGPFHPVPAVQAILLVFGLWATWLLTQLVSPPEPVTWLVWSRRAFLFFVVGVFWFIALFVIAWRAAGVAKPWHLTRPTTAFAVAVLTLVALAVWTTAIKHKWPYPPLESAILTAAFLYVGYQVVGDFRSWPARKWGPHPFRLRRPQTYGMTLFLGVAAAIGALLTASLGGTVAGQAVVQGCNPLTTITFDPVPESILTNHTYGFILRSNGYLYVHEIQPWKNQTLLIPESGREIRLGWTPSSGDCT